MNRFVYLDNNATTKVSNEIREKILPFLDLQFGNPSSIYTHGSKIKKQIISARENCAKLVGASADNIVFTSGGSESNCSAFNSAVYKYPQKRTIITTKVEHASIIEYCDILKRRGYKIKYIDVDKNCKIDIKQLEKYMDNDVLLVSIQFANNEVGTIIADENVVESIKNLKQKYDFAFHCDCVQGLGKSKINVQELGVDFASFSGHKIHCPKGIGFMFIKDTKNFTPLIAGHQEFGLRGGTENVVGIIALSESAKHICNNFEEINQKLVQTQKYLLEKLKQVKSITINAEKVEKIPNTLSITFDNINGNELLLKLEEFGICVSTGSACNSESSEPSYVLTSMGISNPQNTIRVSIDENTTKSQVDYFVENLKNIIQGV